MHDRKKTFQPLDLRDWLLKFAILLFPLDVAVRRIQLDRDEWSRAVTTLRRRLFFWKGIPRTKDADESLAALLSRREQVRSQRPTPVAAPGPDLFRPEKPARHCRSPTRQGTVCNSGRRADGKGTAQGKDHDQPSARCQAQGAKTGGPEMMEFERDFLVGLSEVEPDNSSGFFTFASPSE